MKTQWIVPPQRTLHLAPTGDQAVCIVETLPNTEEQPAMVEVRNAKEAQALVNALCERFNLPNNG